MLNPGLLKGVYSRPPPPPPRVHRLIDSIDNFTNQLGTLGRTHGEIDGEADDEYCPNNTNQELIFELLLLAETDPVPSRLALLGAVDEQRKYNQNARDGIHLGSWLMENCPRLNVFENWTIIRRSRVKLHCQTSDKKSHWRC